MDDRGQAQEQELSKAIDLANRRMFAELAAWQVAMMAGRTGRE